MDDLVTWFRAQLDEDERVIARNRGEAGLSDRGTFPDYRTYDGEDLEAADDYLATFAPPRMQAEVDAKRTLIARLEGLLLYATSPNYAHGGIEAWATDTLKHAAVPYADRDGYLPEWAPDGS